MGGSPLCGRFELDDLGPLWGALGKVGPGR
jgi:hypothetical protein